MLGAVLETVFKDDVTVKLHSFPAPNVASGCFIYDVELGGDLDHAEWRPSKAELMTLSAQMHRLAEQNLPLERLEVEPDVALEMFSGFEHKQAQIPSVAASSEDGKTVTLYRVGQHVDISKGPMAGSTSFLGRRCTVAAAHAVQSEGVKLFRFQGVALPKNVFLNHYAFSILERRAAQLVRNGLQ